MVVGAGTRIVTSGANDVVVALPSGLAVPPQAAASNEIRSSSAA